ncbi:translation elongation factor Tu [Cladophialophora immunda]|uniref:Elongation factor 1 alpha-like protein n=1 Tax=Cladophialophora immunda TaxID=569365 RepID=A0A0D1Z3C1_9EURO|nr:translation elongation factor Tu [Cladophialophora immunda]KIW22156.1 translation elongation factor Tu [Cladophialophora immunda]OQV09418.1 small GTP-binding protein domain-containing protein [Cladophialophora immunda]
MVTEFQSLSESAPVLEPKPPRSTSCSHRDNQIQPCSSTTVMSNRRVKSLALDEDDYDDYEDYEGDYGDDGGDNELSAEDKEQMQQGTNNVRAALGSAFPVTDNEIQEALWHYYYDVGKSVAYLKNKQKPTPVATKKQMNGSKKPSPDDVVTKAQTAKAATSATSKAKDTNRAKSALAGGMHELSIQDAPKIKSKNIDVLAEYQKNKRKNAANFVVIGHVDAGKSTLMGRLLFDLKAVDQRTLDKYRQEAERIGKGSFAFAWVLDQGSEERARGVTIDIATNKFETDRTCFTILDAPGHRDFVPNMIAGASQADFAVLVIDASTGNFESGLKGQTKEHALLVRSIGVQRIIVAVNKMDVAEWSEKRFDEIRQQMAAFLSSAGFQSKNVTFVPCSGLGGENILTRASDSRSFWYTGPTLVEELDKAEPSTHALDKPLRMIINDVFRGGVQNPLSVSGRLDAGTIQVGEQVVIMPSGEKAQIRSLEVDDEPQEWAVAGQNVVLNLTDIDPIHLKSGDVLCSPLSPIQNIGEFKAKILAFDHLTPMNVDVHKGRLHVPGRISQLVGVLDKSSGTVTKKKPKIVQPGNVVRVIVHLDQVVPLEPPSRIVLRANGETVGAGLIE